MANIKIILELAQEGKAKEIIADLKELIALTEGRRAVNKKTSQAFIKQAEAQIKAIKRLGVELRKNGDLLKKASSEKEIVKLNNEIRKGALQQEKASLQAKKLADQRRKFEEAQIKRQRKTNDGIRKERGLIGGLQIELAKLKKQRAFARTEQDVRKLNQRIKTTQIRIRQLSKAGVKDTNTFGNALGSFGFKFNVLANIASSATFAITRGIREAFNTLKDFEQQMARVQAITGATDDEFGLLIRSAKTLGSTTRFTAIEVGSLQLSFSKLGFSTSEILNATAATLELATATQADLAQSATVAAATIRGFGLDASETQRIVDVMAASFSASALDLSKFQVAMANVAPAAKNAGLSVERTTALLGLLVNRGIDASKAGTDLRNIFLELAKQGLTFEKAMTKINTATNKNRVALDLFGKRGAISASILAENTEEADKFTEALNNAEGAAAAMAAIIEDTLQGDLLKLTSAWEGLILAQDKSGSLFRIIIQEVTRTIIGFQNLTQKISLSTRAINSLFGLLEKREFTADELESLVTFGITDESNLKISDLVKEITKMDRAQLDAIGTGQKFRARLVKEGATIEEAAQIIEFVIQKRREEITILDMGTEAIEKETEAIKKNNDTKKKALFLLGDFRAERRRELKSQELLADRELELSEQSIDNQIKRLEEQIRINELRIEDGTETTVAQIALENKILEDTNRIQDLITKKQKEEQGKQREELEKTIETSQSVGNAIIDGLEKASEKREQLLDKDIDRQKTAIDIQAGLAANGLKNTLAFEEQRAADLERKRIEEQRKQEKLAKAQAFFNAFAEFAKDEPDTAAARAFITVQLADVIAGSFREGSMGTIGETLDRKGVGGGVRNSIIYGDKHSDSSGGAIIQVERDEGMLSAKEMKNLGRDNFYDLKKLAKNPIDDTEIFGRHKSFVMPIRINNNKDIILKLDSLEKTIKNKKETNVNWDSVGNLIIAETKRGMKRITKKQRTF